MLAPPDILTQLAAPWAKFYGHSRLTATVVEFLHIAPLIVAGGLAVALDRSTLRLDHDDPGARERHLAELGTVHRVILGGLAVSLLSGLALLASDLETFWGSWIFWLKMALVVLLLANGGMMTRLERALRANEGDPDAGWRRLRNVAIASVTLWLTITLAGVALTNLA
jgi:uncharacterized membrane protein